MFGPLLRTLSRFDSPRYVVVGVPYNENRRLNECSPACGHADGLKGIPNMRPYYVTVHELAEVELLFSCLSLKCAARTVTGRQTPPIHAEQASARPFLRRYAQLAGHALGC